MTCSLWKPGARNGIPCTALSPHAYFVSDMSDCRTQPLNSMDYGVRRVSDMPFMSDNLSDKCPT
jgi:hypothetical protein